MEINEILQALVGLVATVAIYLVTAYFRAKTASIKDEHSRAIAETVVLAVEQTVKDMHGKSKYGLAESELREMLRKRNLPVDDDTIKALIEAAVAKLNAPAPS